jgi:ABC-type amino acid transport substrate-binding protein
MRHGALISFGFALLVLASVPGARPLDKVKKDALTVGIRVGNAPFGYNETGERKGLEYDLAAAIAEGMGCRFRMVPIPNQRDGEDKLLTDKIDVVIGAVKATPELKERFLTSNPYFRTGLGIMVMKSNQSVFTLNDLNDRYVAVTPESNADKLIESFLPKAKLEVVRGISEGVGMLQKGDVEAVVHDRSSLQTEASRNQAFRLLDVSLTEDSYVILVNKKSANLLDAVNIELDRLRTVPSPEMTTPIANLCGRYKLGMTLKPIIKPGSAMPAPTPNPNAAVQPATPAPRPQVSANGPMAPASPPTGTNSAAPAGSAAAKDLDKRMDGLERQLQEIQKTLAEIKAAVQKGSAAGK